jgi:hypothetical protein
LISYPSFFTQKGKKLGKDPGATERVKKTPVEIAEREKEDYFCRLWEKYENASRYPWLPVAPDPPEPK